MTLTLNGFSLNLTIRAAIDGDWLTLPATSSDRGVAFDHKGVRGQLSWERELDRIKYELTFTSTFPTRLRVALELRDQTDLFHLIPGNIHGDNNAAHVRPGEFPVLALDRPHERNRAGLWEFRAERASHPVSILCCDRGAVGIAIDPYSSSADAAHGLTRNGVFAALPNAFGVSLGYGNDPLTFQEKTVFRAATSDLSRGATAHGTIFAIPGDRRAAHQIIRALYAQMRERPTHQKSPRDALWALADAFIEVNWSPELNQYTNRKCRRPVDLKLEPWRAIVEIGWTGGSMMAYPFVLARTVFPDLRFPKTGSQIFDEICAGFNERSGLINDAAVNRFTRSIPAGWNTSEINGWWSGFLPQTRDGHCAYTNAHAAYYILKLNAVAQDSLPASVTSGAGGRIVRGDIMCISDQWLNVALRVLDTAVELQRADGAFGYIFSSTEKRVIDFEGFAGCWFAAALPLAWKLAGRDEYRASADRALDFYAPFIRNLAAWGSPMDTYKSVDSEGNLAFMRAARLMHEFTGDQKYVDMLIDGAHYEYLWRYGFRTRPQSPPLKESNWNSCGGTITSVSNPHIHPMGVVATSDLEYLGRVTGDDYHQQRADDGIAWLMNTMELYPHVMGYGRYGVLSERTCPSDGLLAERFYDDDSPSSTWWSYNAWAAASAMEGLAEWILARNK